MRLFRLGWCALALAAGSVAAQPAPFGSSDDVFETAARPSASVYAGPAFVRSGWRTVVDADVTLREKRLSASIGGALHPGTGGLYDDEADDLYDVARLVRYVRLDPGPGDRTPYVRLGPTQNLTLASGLLAHRYRTTTAWDDRRISAEAVVGGERVQAAAFLGDVSGAGVVGAQVEVGTGASAGPVRGLRATLAAVHDLGGPYGGDGLTGAELRVQGDLFAEGGLSVSPYVAYARYAAHGGGLGVGVEAEADNLGNVGRAAARIGVVASGKEFAPGVVGAFYAIDNPRDRIVVAESFYDSDPAFELAGTPLDSIRAGVDVVVDARGVAFGRFEGRLHVRRHIGADRLSAFGFRIAARASGARFELGLEREGFRTLLGLLGRLGEQNTLTLDIAAPVPALGGATAFVRSRYGYRRLPEDTAGPNRFLIERRFEPMIGLRTSL